MRRTAGLLVSLCAAALAPGGTALAQPAAQAPDPPTGSLAQSDQSPAAPPDQQVQSTSFTGVPVVSLERIRSLLEARSDIRAAVLTADDIRPVFRSRVDEKYFTLPSLASRLRQDRVVSTPGGLTRWEINRLTRPGTYPGMSSAGVDVLGILVWAVEKGGKAWERHQVRRIREEIRLEIAAIEEANRRKAAEAAKASDPIK